MQNKENKKVCVQYSLICNIDVTLGRRLRKLYVTLGRRLRKLYVTLGRRLRKLYVTLGRRLRKLYVSEGPAAVFTRSLF